MTRDPTHVAFLAPLPGDAQAQEALAEVVAEALANLPGPWKVGVTTGPQSGALILTAYRDDGFECTVFMDGPLQRTFLYIRDQVVNALQLHVLGIPRLVLSQQKPKN